MLRAGLFLVFLALAGCGTRPRPAHEGEPPPAEETDVLFEEEPTTQSLKVAEEPSTSTWVSAPLVTFTPDLITEAARGVDRFVRDLVGAPSPAETAFRHELDTILNRSSFQHATWGAMVYSLEKDQLLYARNPAKSCVPASNLKLLLTAAALEKLGPGFQYETRLLAEDTQWQDGQLDGDLVVVGSGDPTFSPHFYRDDPLAPFRPWVEELQSKGVKRVTGRLIGDDNCFDEEGLAEGWSWHYLDAWYAAPAGGLSFHDNCLLFRIFPGDKANSPVKVRVEPDAFHGLIQNEARTSSRRAGENIRVERDTNGMIYRVTGKQYQRSRGYERWVTVPDPTLFFLSNLEAAFEESGIEIVGGIADLDSLGDGPPRKGLVKVGQRLSPPLAEMLPLINGKSQNLYANQIHKTLGRRYYHEGSWKAGTKVLRRFLEQCGVDKKGTRFTDGAGLARTNLIRPDQLLAVLIAMDKSPNAAVYKQSLARPGRKGTLEKRLTAGITRNRVYAKTGFIMGALALSGYVQTVEGEPLAFVCILNQSALSPSSAISALDDFATALVQFQRRP